MGPSGCGKSTLLRLLAGLLPSTSGSLTLGEPLRGPGRKSAIVFPSPVLLPWRTILQNILLPIEFRKWPIAEYRRKAVDLLALVGLGQFVNTFFPMSFLAEYGGTAAIVRALVQDPKLLLMDEPFGALDAMTREQLNLEVLRIWSRSRKTRGLRHPFDRGIHIPIGPGFRHDVAPRYARGDHRHRSPASARSQDYQHREVRGLRGSHPIIARCQGRAFLMTVLNLFGKHQGHLSGYRKLPSWRSVVRGYPQLTISPRHSGCDPDGMVGRQPCVASADLYRSAPGAGLARARERVGAGTVGSWRLLVSRRHHEVWEALLGFAMRSEYWRGVGVYHRPLADPGEEHISICGRLSIAARRSPWRP